MIVTIRIEAGQAGGKTHLAEALKNFFIHDYDNISRIEVGIVEANPHDPHSLTHGTRMSIGPAAKYKSPTDAVIDRVWPHNGLYWFKSERSSFRSIAQKPNKDKDEWWVIGEDEPLTMCDLLTRGWELDEEAS